MVCPTVLNTRLFAEFFASLLLTCLSCLGCLNGGQDNLIPLQFGFVSGLMVTTIIHCFGFISGGYANPLLVLAHYRMGFLSSRTSLAYVLVQLLGALAGYGILKLMLPSDALDGLCLAKPSDKLEMAQVVAYEFILTSVLILSWCAAWDVRNNALDSVALRLGFITLACSLAGYASLGASLNPARMLAAAAFLENYQHIPHFFCSHVLAAFIVPQVWMRALTTTSLPISDFRGDDDEDGYLYS